MIEKLKKILSREKKVLFAYIYGSYVRNKRYVRDIDIAVYVKGRVSFDFERKLKSKIEEKIKKEVEVSVLNDKPLLFISEVMRNSMLIFSRDEKTRVRFETSILSEIQSFNELMKEFDKYRLKRYGIG